MSKTEVFTAYSPEVDMTFIVEEVTNDDNITIKVVGFYYGTPNDDCTRVFYGKNEAVLEL